LSLTGNLQLRYLVKDIHLTPNSVYDEQIYELDWLFLSPRLGVNYTLTDNLTSYFSFSIASHEPNDDMIDDADDPGDAPRLEIVDSTVSPVVYGDPTVDAERVYDFEAGADYRSSRLSVDVNLFWMEYRNEIVPNGDINDDGFPTLGNADRSVHRGIEIAARYSPLDNLTISGDYSFNDNWIVEFDQYLEREGGGIDTVRHRDVYVPQFPKFLANLSLNYKYERAQFIYRLRGVGRQFPYYNGRNAWFEDEGKFVDVSIAPFVLHSIKGIFDIGRVLGAQLKIEGRVNNLFGHKYESFGAYDDGVFYYWPAAERNWFVNVKLTI